MPLEQRFIVQPNWKVRLLIQKDRRYDKALTNPNFYINRKEFI